jgi:hypothetical protein
MAARKAQPLPAEPLGIVISNGDREEPPPFFWAYVWSAVPDSQTPVVKTRLA